MCYGSRMSRCHAVIFDVMERKLQSVDILHPGGTHAVNDLADIREDTGCKCSEDADDLCVRICNAKRAEEALVPALKPGKVIRLFKAALIVSSEIDDDPLRLETRAVFSDIFAVEPVCIRKFSRKDVFLVTLIINEHTVSRHADPFRVPFHVLCKEG